VQQIGDASARGVDPEAGIQALRVALERDDQSRASSEADSQPLPHSAQLATSATAQAIWLTLFRTLWYDPVRCGGGEGAGCTCEFLVF
jgi:hypothetical protein